MKTNNGGMAKAWMAGGGGDLTLTGGDLRRSPSPFLVFSPLNEGEQTNKQITWDKKNPSFAFLGSFLSAVTR